MEGGERSAGWPFVNRRDATIPRCHKASGGPAPHPIRHAQPWRRRPCLRPPIHVGSPTRHFSYSHPATAPNIAGTEAGATPHPARQTVAQASLPAIPGSRRLPDTAFLLLSPAAPPNIAGTEAGATPHPARPAVAQASLPAIPDSRRLPGTAILPPSPATTPNTAGTEAGATPHPARQTVAQASLPASPDPRRLPDTAFLLLPPCGHAQHRRHGGRRHTQSGTPSRGAGVPACEPGPTSAPGFGHPHPHRANARPISPPSAATASPSLAVRSA